MEIPTINVNLSPCDCISYTKADGTHTIDCASSSLPLPCPIPRSVTFEVRLGECTCATKPGPMLLHRTVGFIEEAHEGGCPARPVKVSCSISGETWQESEPEEVDTSRGPDGFRVQFREDEALVACRTRWAPVKALVLGRQAEPAETEPVLSLLSQRDAVYAALADMARAEEAAVSAQRALAPFRLQSRGYGHKVRLSDRPSAGYLEEFVSRLIEQVGVLP